MVASMVRDQAIQTASAITAAAFTTVRIVCAIQLSFWNQPKLMPTFQASQRSKNGVTLTTPRLGEVEHVEQPQLARLIERERDQRSDDAGAQGTVHTVTPSAFHSRKRQRVARRDVGIFRVLADGRQDLPRPRAFAADRLLDHDGDALDVGQREGVGRRRRRSSPSRSR